ncbi:MAG: hypothetical protein ABSH21_04690 [Verrucomicrobiia bacterium]|jgi:hypothetical protein
MKDVFNSTRFTTTSRLQRATAGKRVGTDWRLLILIAALLIGTTGSVLAAAKFVNGLAPDWNQPYRYGPPPGGPTDPFPVPPNAPGNATQWNAWCAPSAAANLVGHWTDAHGVPVADAFAFPSTTNWPLAASWHDYQADGFARPTPPQAAAGALPVPATDIGWYLDTNRGIQWDNGLGTMGGYYFGNAVHTGTYLKDIQPGLQNFLNSRYSLSSSNYWLTGTRGFNYFSGVNPAGVPNVAPYPNEINAFAEVKSEIDSNRTLILCFMYWNPVKTVYGVAPTGTNTESAFGYTNYVLQTPSSPYTNAEDETWNFNDDGSALGHAVTCVGYIPAGDPADPYRATMATDWVIVHDNWVSTPRNVAVPYGTPTNTPGGTFNVAWVANTTANAWTTGVKFVNGFVPDWNQPYRYNPQSPNGGPGQIPPPPPPGQWSDWCVPTSAANLAGHWEDHHGAPVADGTAFAGSTVAWAAGPSWQDYLADGFARPAAMNAPGLPPSPTDIGWYMDTNRGMGGGGYFFAGDGNHWGTYVKNIHIGLANYLNSLYSCLYTNNASGWWDTGTEGKNFAAGLDPTGGVAQVLGDPVSAFKEVKSEINRDHTLIISFLHWNVFAVGALDLATDSTNSEAQFGGSYYTFDTSPGSSNDEEEVWNDYNGDYGLGHAVTCVGYIPAGDPLDPLGGTDWVIVHDNWASTPRNVIVPFDYVNNWVANTTAVPDPGFLRITRIELAARTNAVISFTGIPSTLHDLEWKSDMTNSTWSTAISNVAFTAGTMQMTNTVDSSVAQRFYRIKATD